MPLKLIPALFILYFLWRRNWKFILGSLAGGLLVLAATWATVGLSGVLAYGSMILAQLKAGGVAAFNNQSIAGFPLHVLTNGDMNGWETIPVPAFVTIVRYILVIALLVAVVWAMRRRTEKLGQPRLAEDLDLSLLIGVMLLASPITWYHYYVWLLLPLVVVFDQLLSGATGWRNFAFHTGGKYPLWHLTTVILRAQAVELFRMARSNRKR